MSELKHNETDRLAALQRYGILDTPPSPIFQSIANTAAIAFSVPIAAVSLIDTNRQWFKASHGLEICETGRDVAFCAHTIQDDEPLIVPDAAHDPRFAGNPLVTGAPHIRFYAGVPLIDADGYALGSFCIIDQSPRLISDDEMTMLQGFGQFALTALTAHREGAAA